MLEIKGRNGGAPMAKGSAGKPARDHAAGYALLHSQEPLPPYELDPEFDSPVIRNRIGRLIANATEHRFSKR
jgi:hypothetical protein